MRDAITTLFRAGRIAPRATAAALLFTMACGLGGCAGVGSSGVPFAQAGNGATVTLNRSMARRRRCSTAW
jgi:hypothetical protein